MPHAVKQIVHDFELNGQLCRALKQDNSSEFSLMLAMLQQDAAYRPSLQHSESPGVDNEVLKTLPKGPAQPLAMSASQWSKLNVDRQALQTSMMTLRLEQLLHPTPLAQHNNPKRIEADVLQNCEWSVRQRIQHGTGQRLPVEETDLYEILNQLHPEQHQAA